jgi:hypothetical protein
VRHNAQSQLHTHLLKAHIAEYIYLSATMFPLVLPLGAEYLYLANTGSIEEFGLAVR